MVFKRYSMGGWGKFQRYFKDIKSSFKGVSRKIKGCSKRPSRAIQVRFKGIEKKFKEFFIGVFMAVSRVFKDSVKCVPKKIQIKFQEFSRMFQWRFVFALLLLHGSHRSYPSRRRSCFYSSQYKITSYPMCDNQS